jgi:hypothetical protein
MMRPEHVFAYLTSASEFSARAIQLRQKFGFFFVLASYFSNELVRLK